MESKINELEVGDIHLFYMDVSDIDTDAEYPKLSRYRAEKVSRTKNKRDKQLSLGSELLLIYGIEKYYPQIQIPLNYKISDSGKPYFDGIHFNLAHSGKIAVCAIADTEIGVDIELKSRNNNAIAEKYYTDRERRYDMSYIWTRKEAVVKADGSGISAGIDTFDVSTDTVLFGKTIYNIMTLTNEINGYYLSLAW